MDATGLYTIATASSGSNITLFTENMVMPQDTTTFQTNRPTSASGANGAHLVTVGSMTTPDQTLMIRATLKSHVISFSSYTIYRATFNYLYCYLYIVASAGNITGPTGRITTDPGSIQLDGVTKYTAYSASLSLVLYGSLAITASKDTDTYLDTCYGTGKVSLDTDSVCTITFLRASFDA